MPIKFNCHCGKKLVARSAMAGKQIRCPECNDLLLLPKINIGKPLEKKREPKQVPIVSNAPPQIPPTNPNEPRVAGQPATPQANAPLSSALDRPPSNNLGNPPAAPIAHPIHYEAPKGSPLSRAVDQNFNDSILMALPIVSINPRTQGVLIDFSSIFLTDFAGLGLGAMDRSRSSWHKIKAFPNNLEMQVEATFGSRFASGTSMSDDGVVDPRGVTVVVHYSLAKRPSAAPSP